MFGKEKLVFDPAAASDTDNVGAYVRSSDGTLITHTTNGAKEGLDVNIINDSIEVTANDLDIRDLDHAQDNVAIAQGGNTMVVNPDGSINVNADIDVVTGAEKAEDSAHSSTDIGQYVLAVRQDTLASSTSDDGDYASFKVNEEGALWVKLFDSTVEVPPPTFNSWNVSQNVVDDAAELVVAADLTGRRRMLIQNASSSRIIYLGHSNAVTAADGLKLSAGAAIEIDVAEGVEVYAIANGAGADVRVAEFAA